MKKRLIFSILSVILVVLATVAWTYRDPLIVKRDHILGQYREYRGTMTIRTGTLVDHSQTHNWVNRYQDIPENFEYIAPFLFFRAPGKVRVEELAYYAIRFTPEHSVKAFRKKLMAANNLEETTIPADTNLVIPGSLPPLEARNAALEERKVPFIRGIYITGHRAGSESFRKMLPRLKEVGINAVVFDAKDIPGILSYYSATPTARKYNTHARRSIDNIHQLIREMEKEGIYSIVRIAVFRDHLLARSNPELAITSRSTGRLFNAAGEIWCDPTNREVQDYNIGLAKELAKAGADEIQFDYIRFPTGGNLADAVYNYDFGKKSRQDTIAHFLSRARKAVRKEDAFLSIDIFGIVAWGKEIDMWKTGQQIEKLASNCDVISPMLYPSHFNDNFEGHPRPGDAPYYFIKRGTKLVRSRAGESSLIRPWLQAFGWRVSRYDEDYIRKQIKACRDSGAHGYLFWNAKNDYRVVFRAMRELAGEE